MHVLAGQTGEGPGRSAVRRLVEPAVAGGIQDIRVRRVTRQGDDPAASRSLAGPVCPAVSAAADPILRAGVDDAGVSGAHAQHRDGRQAGGDSAPVVPAIAALQDLTAQGAGVHDVG